MSSRKQAEHRARCSVTVVSGTYRCARNIHVSEGVVSEAYCCILRLSPVTVMNPYLSETIFIGSVNMMDENVQETCLLMFTIL